MNRKNLILALVLLALILLVYGYRVLYPAWQRDQKQIPNFTATLPLDQIDRITLTKSGATTTLSQDSGRWRVVGDGDFYVEPSLMADALSSLARLTTSSLAIVSLESANKVLFGLTDQSATELSFFKQDQELLSFKLGTSGLPSYLSPAADQRTYSVLTDLSLWQIREWRNKTIFDSEIELWQSLSVENKLQPHLSWSARRIDGRWQSSNGQLLATDKIRPLVNALSQLSAAALPDQKPADSGLDRPTWVITVSSDNLSNRLLVGKRLGDNYYVQTGANHNIYLVDKGIIDLFTVSLTALK